jgi:hypothetical protein
MNIVQLCQILFVALIGVFALIVAWNNLRDPQSNLRLVEHLLSMDSVFPDTRLKDRAIASPGSTAPAPTSSTPPRASPSPASASASRSGSAASW